MNQEERNAILDASLDLYHEHQHDPGKGINGDTHTMIVELLRIGRPISAVEIAREMNWSVDKTQHRLRSAKNAGLIAVQLAGNDRLFRPTAPASWSTQQQTTGNGMAAANEPTPREKAARIIADCNEALKQKTIVHAPARLHDVILQDYIIKLLDHGWAGYEDELVEELTYDPPEDEIRVAASYLIKQARFTAPRE